MEEFRVCPECGYQRGFHVSFRNRKNSYKIIFICPSCGSAYDLNLKTDKIESLNETKINQYKEN
ncbi:MAG: hypothetical protein FXF47_09395 [Candidatus Mcinerneyibacterium aminivorans]|jgi:uncharacterized Zn finger protein|uniref:Uncharacterized protein n=1 Tax=Candidatus Mcinerneyibacterium aminivorans TaxID=2703815 RepID=A0A5D0MFJ2_9BACT|nr:MAG: hypothetical protein FXF47_09395 [Candidatus Mcinerneyibacterium aminivorans]